MTTPIELAGLSTYVFGPAGAKTACVLLHGFGANADDLVPLADMIDAPVRWLVPDAPLELAQMSRAWWMLDIAQLEADMRSGVARDRRAEVPAELATVRARMTQLLDEAQARFGFERLVLGGFSQGAMLALDVALHRPQAPAGLLLMSGTLIADAVWQPRMAHLAGVPVVLSHGRHDALLPFAAAEELRDRLRAAGAVVDWQPFVGGHEIPPDVLDAAGQLLNSVATG